MSIVKIVDVEFNIDAKDETMAAANAAKANPFRPVGKNCSNHGYALSAWAVEGMFNWPASPNPAMMAGSLIMT